MLTYILTVGESAPNAWMQAVSSGIADRREANGAPKDLNPPQESLTEPRDEGILTIDTPGRSWEQAIWEMPVDIPGRPWDFAVWEISGETRATDASPAQEGDADAMGAIDLG